jgi:hypothetical protein
VRRTQCAEPSRDTCRATPAILSRDQGWHSYRPLHGLAHTAITARCVIIGPTCLTNIRRRQRFLVTHHERGDETALLNVRWCRRGPYSAIAWVCHVIAWRGV